MRETTVEYYLFLKNKICNICPDIECNGLDTKCLYRFIMQAKRLSDGLENYKK